MSALAASSCQKLSQYSFQKLPTHADIEFGTLQMPDDRSSFQKITVADVGKAPFGSTLTQTFNVRNIGDLDASSVQVSLDAAVSTENFRLTNRCPSGLKGEGADVCSFDISFSPQSLGKMDGAIRVNFEDGKGELREARIPITGLANNLAFLKFEVDSTDLANSTIGYTVSARVKVLYNGSSIRNKGFTIQPARIVSLGEPTPGGKGFSIDRAHTTCVDPISDDCYIAVNYGATAVGPAAGSFALSYFNGAEVLRIKEDVTGNGLAAKIIATLSTPASVDFGLSAFRPKFPKRIDLPVTFNGSIPADNVVITGPTNPVFSIDPDPSKTTCDLSSPGMINGSCILSLLFNPDVRGVYTDQIQIAYRSNDQARPTLTIPIKGEARGPSKIIITSAVPLDFGSTPAFKAVNQTVTLKNTGEIPVEQFRLLNADATDFITIPQSACDTLAPGASCTVSVAFKPTTANPYAATMIVDYLDGQAYRTLSFDANGVGLAPLVMETGNVALQPFIIGKKFTPTTQQIQLFGTIPLSTPSQLTISAGSLSPFAFLGGSFPGTGATCAPPNIAPIDFRNCTYKLDIPDTVTGMVANSPISRTFSLTYADDAGNPPKTLNITVTATPKDPPALISVSAPAFGTLSVNNTSTLDFTFRNNSVDFATAALNPAGATATVSDPAFSVVSNSCSATVARNATCTVRVAFHPTASGSFSGTLSVPYNNQISNQSISVPLSGAGSPDVTLSASPASVSFGSVFLGDPIPSQTVTIAYFGTNTYTPSFSVAPPFNIVSNGCGAAGNCTLTVSFSPTTAGSFNQTVNFDYSPSVPVPGRLTLTLSGTAAARNATIAIAGSAFPKTLIGSSADQVFTIQNNGTAAANALAFPTLTGEFTYAPGGGPGTAGNCGPTTTLAAGGGSCTIKIRFAPSAVGSRSKAFAITAKDASSGTTLNASANLTGIGTQLIKVFAGSYHTCILNELGQAICWGKNAHGQLGQGNTNVIGAAPQSISPVNLGAGASVTRIAVGGEHTCAIVSNASRTRGVVCWGNNDEGQLGQGSAAAIVSSPVDAGGNPRFVNLGTAADGSAERAVDIAAGYAHTCAALDSGSVKCWGVNTDGQLGVGSTAAIGSSASDMGNALTAVDLKAAATGVAAGAGHSCALLADSTIKCWGNNFYGQLGQGTNAYDTRGTAPGEVGALGAVKLGAGGAVAAVFASQGAFTCAQLQSGNVKCFGKTVTPDSYYGMLGSCWARRSINTTAAACSAQASWPVTDRIGTVASDMGDALTAVSLPQPVVQLAPGYYFTCAVLADSSVRCWGSNDHGQLGNGSTANTGASPAEMGANLKAALVSASGVSPVSVAAGTEHACAVLSNNTVRCWGSSAENATGLASVGVSGDTGAAPRTPDTLPNVYDGRI